MYYVRNVYTTYVETNTYGVWGCHYFLHLFYFFVSYDRLVYIYSNYGTVADRNADQKDELFETDNMVFQQKDSLVNSQVGYGSKSKEHSNSIKSLLLAIE